jgi:hypothetical protein
VSQNQGLKRLNPGQSPVNQTGDLPKASSKAFLGHLTISGPQQRFKLGLLFFIFIELNEIKICISSFFCIQSKPLVYHPHRGSPPHLLYQAEVMASAKYEGALTSLCGMSVRILGRPGAFSEPT